MISSRQSPSRSAVSAGVDLVPLFEAQPLALRIELPPYLLIDVPSSSSRVSSPSHQMRKFCDDGLLPRLALLVAEIRPSVLDAHISAPGFDAEMSSATQRPVSAPLIGPSWMIAQVRASRMWYAGWSPSSLHMNISMPARDGIRSPTCSASP